MKSHTAESWWYQHTPHERNGYQAAARRLAESAIPLDHRLVGSCMETARIPLHSRHTAASCPAKRVAILPDFGVLLVLCAFRAESAHSPNRDARAHRHDVDTLDHDLRVAHLQED